MDHWSDAGQLQHVEDDKVGGALRIRAGTDAVAQGGEVGALVRPDDEFAVEDGVFRYGFADRCRDVGKVAGQVLAVAGLQSRTGRCGGEGTAPPAVVLQTSDVS